MYKKNDISLNFFRRILTEGTKKSAAERKEKVKSERDIGAVLAAGRWRETTFTRSLKTSIVRSPGKVSRRRREEPKARRNPRINPNTGEERVSQIKSVPVFLCR